MVMPLMLVRPAVTAMMLPAASRRFGVAAAMSPEGPTKTLSAPAPLMVSALSIVIEEVPAAPVPS